MKNIYSIYSLLALIIFLSSCVDENNIRVPEVIEGPNVRIKLEEGFEFFDYANIDDARIKYSIFSENINKIEKIEISFVFTRDGISTDPEVIKTYTAANFNNGIAKDEITANDIAQALGFANGTQDFNGGDIVVFHNRTFMHNGNVYPSVTPAGYTNVDPGITAAAATTSFTARFNAFIGCDVTGLYLGKYMVEQVSGPADVFFGNEDRWANEEITITAVGPIGRRFSGTYFTFDGITFNFSLLCGRVLVPFTSSGLSCGGPALAWTSDGIDNLYDDEDDSELTIVVWENVDNGCGIDPTPVQLTLKLTKI